MAKLSRMPRNVMQLLHWESDPDFGVTGTVYLAARTMYYSNSDQGETDWCDIGPLPDSLEDKL